MIKVKFKGYKYNTGAGDNGFSECEKEFEALTGVAQFIKYLFNLIEKHKIKSDYSENDYNFLTCFGIDYVTDYLGTFEIHTMERQIYIEKFL